MTEAELLGLILKALTPLVAIVVTVSVPLIKGTWKSSKEMTKLRAEVEATNIYLKFQNEKLLEHNESIKTLERSVNDSKIVLTDHETRIKVLEDEKRH